MQIKQFSGATIDEVLAQVRQELGEDAVILQTKRVVKGGIGGFFGREGVEVTAADGLGAEGERANREAAASVAAPAARATDPLAGADDAGEEPAGAAAEAPDADATDAEVPAEATPTPFARHLDARLSAAVEAESGAASAAGPPASAAASYARSGAPFSAGERERTEAIVEAARAAVRQAHEAAIDPIAEAEAIAPAPVIPPDPPARADDARPGGRAPRQGPGGSIDGVRGELVRAGIDPRYLDPFLDGFARSVEPFLGPRDNLREAVREHLAARLPVARDWKAPPAGHTIAFVGQSGVGKTTAAAGIAGRYRAAGLAVALIAAGDGPHDALEGHARRMDVQLFRAPDGATLARLRETLVDRDLVVVDTVGRSHQRLDEIEGLAALLAPVRPDEVHLVLPLATPLADLGDVQRRFRMVGVSRLALTKLDETRHVGNLVNMPLRMGKPVAYLSDSPGVPGAVAPADAGRIAGMILP